MIARQRAVFPARMTAYLSIESLCVGYGSTRVLDDVSLGIGKGELVALLGSSGCGKTTLLRAIAGFVEPESGSIRVDGQDLLALPPEKRGAAMMFQSYALWPHMSVAGNIGYGLRGCACAAGSATRLPRASRRCSRCCSWKASARGR